MWSFCLWGRLRAHPPPSPPSTQRSPPHVEHEERLQRADTPVDSQSAVAACTVQAAPAPALVDPQQLERERRRLLIAAAASARAAQHDDAVLLADARGSENTTAIVARGSPHASNAGGGVSAAATSASGPLSSPRRPAPSVTGLFGSIPVSERGPPPAPTGTTSASPPSPQDPPDDDREHRLARQRVTVTRYGISSSLPQGDGNTSAGSAQGGAGRRVTTGSRRALAKRRVITLRASRPPPPTTDVESTGPERAPDEQVVERLADPDWGDGITPLLMHLKALKDAAELVGQDSATYYDVRWVLDFVDGAHFEEGVKDGYLVFWLDGSTTVEPLSCLEELVIYRLRMESGIPPPNPNHLGFF